jgi:hypothetical protein
MEIISLRFFGFVFVAVILYHILPKKFKPLWLLFSSTCFYILIDPLFFLVLLILLLANFVLAFGAFKTGRKKTWTSMAIFMNLMIFVLLKILRSKYAVILFGVSDSGLPEWLLPVGFSFYILQLISFHLEIIKGHIRVLPGFTDFALFISYFPKLLSGPIEKPVEFLKQIRDPHLVDNSQINKAFGLIFIGLIRKLFIANLLSLVMPDWIQEIDSINWYQMIGYVVYLYNDFCGYTSIVRGISLLFGIELSLNFQQPFLSRNFSEFWNRWHISLSNWLKETIFFPLSRTFKRMNRGFSSSTAALLVPPLATMLASGFWHGAAAGMLFWGCLHALLLVFEQLLYQRFPIFRPQSLPAWGKFISGSIVFLAFTMTMVTFTVSKTMLTIRVWGNLFSASGFAIGDTFVPVVLLSMLSFFVDFLSAKFHSDLWWKGLSLIPKAATIAVGLTIILLCGLYFSSGNSEVFIYQKF